VIFDSLNGIDGGVKMMSFLDFMFSFASHVHKPMFEEIDNTLMDYCKIFEFYKDEKKKKIAKLYEI